MKNLLLTFLFGLFTVAAVAQISPGIRLGAHFNDVSIEDDDIELEGTVAFAGGVFVELALSDNFAVQPELAIIQRGFETDDLFTIGGGRYIETTTYIDIPVLLKINIGGEGTGIYLQGGPQFGYAVNNTITIGGMDQNFEFSDNSDYNRGEVSAVAGAGVKLLGFLVDARYNFGLTSRTNNDLALGDNYNRGLTLALGYIF